MTFIPLILIVVGFIHDCQGRMSSRGTACASLCSGGGDIYGMQRSSACDTLCPGVGFPAHFAGYGYPTGGKLYRLIPSKPHLYGGYSTGVGYGPFSDKEQPDTLSGRGFRRRPGRRGR